MERTIAIGDIHGCSLALAAILKAIDIRTSDTIITLGDLVDRGTDSNGALSQLIALRRRCNVITILGNHDQMMLDARKGPAELDYWLNYGGDNTLDSYGSGRQLDLVPYDHFRFLESSVAYYETETHIFLHACYLPEVPLDHLDGHTLRWLSLRDYVPNKMHCSGKIAYVGHTPHEEIMDLGYLVDIDTRCCKDGWLSAVEIQTGQVWQANDQGVMRAIS